jgi:hypothetical protein
VEGPSFAQLLKAPKLGDVEMGIRDFALLVELNRDLRVPFDPGDWVDNDAASHACPPGARTA